MEKNDIPSFGSDPEIKEYILGNRKADTVAVYFSFFDVNGVSTRLPVVFPYYEGVWTEDKLVFDSIESVNKFCQHLGVGADYE